MSCRKPSFQLTFFCVWRANTFSKEIHTNTIFFHLSFQSRQQHLKDELKGSKGWITNDIYFYNFQKRIIFFVVIWESNPFAKDINTEPTTQTWNENERSQKKIPFNTFADMALFLIRHILLLNIYIWRCSPFFGSHNNSFHSQNIIAMANHPLSLLLRICFTYLIWEDGDTVLVLLCFEHTTIMTDIWKAL